MSKPAILGTIASNGVEIATQELQALLDRVRISELENLPPYMFDAFPSVKDRLTALKASKEEREQK